MILLLLACNSAGWTEDTVMTPHRARFDDDGDGRVTAPEYEARRWNGPPFATADRDGDGDLSPAELAWLVRAQSPTSFDAPQAQPPLALGDVAPNRPTAAQLDVTELLVWMSDSLAAAGSPPLPAPLLDAAVASGRLDSDATRLALGTIGPEWLARGWAWPQGLPPPELPQGVQ